MTNNGLLTRADVRPTVHRLVTAYLVIVLGTVLALIGLTVAAPQYAGQDAWVHTVIVAVFAVLLRLRLRAAERGSVGAARAIRIIAGVLLVVNVVEAAIPGLFPIWMRVLMIITAALMLGVIIASGRPSTNAGR